VGVLRDTLTDRLPLALVLPFLACACSGPVARALDPDATDLVSEVPVIVEVPDRSVLPDVPDSGGPDPGHDPPAGADFPDEPDIGDLVPPPDETGPDETSPEATSDPAGPDETGGPPFSCIPGQWILVGEVPNARDLGGISAAGGTTACGVLFRGSAPTGLGEAGCAAFGPEGIRTVVDLRTETEQAASPTSPCVLQQAAWVPAPLPTPWSVSPSDYVADLHTHASMAVVFQVLGKAVAYPVYFHCIYGRDRTGVVAAVILLALGASREAILADYNLTAEAGYGSYPDSLVAVLGDIDAGGGLDAYLALAGVDPVDVEAMRAMTVVAD
jgi:protein-tyrosine phosphatase